MKVSIVINCFHYAAYVGQAVRSALAQTWPDTEVIVVDDGSTDGSREVIDAILVSTTRLRKVFKPNGGQGSAYNAGFAAAGGDIVLFLDADDWLYPEAAERIASAWAPGVSKVQFQLEVVNAEGHSRGRHVPSEMHDHEALALVSRFGSYGTPPGSGNAYSAEFLRQVLPMDERPWRIAADSVTILLAPAYGRVVSLRQPLGAYRVHRPDSDDSLLFNNAPRGLWAEFERVQRCQALVVSHLLRLDRRVRIPLLLAPWDARLVALCLRFGGRPAAASEAQDAGDVPDTPGATPRPPDSPRRWPRWRLARWALQSLWQWPGLGPVMKLVQSLWMMSLWLLPAPLARPIGRLDRLFKGAPSGA
ncbi:MAG: glycosyltransferase family 2 protein [Burkholderiales bacterium]|nr:glycosyltransferase family 2 protein [Burkholderiales bacterium]